MKPAATRFFPGLTAFLADDASRPKNRSPPVLRFASVFQIHASRRAVLIVSRPAGKWFPGEKQGDEEMAQALGTVTKRDNGGYEGTRAMMTLNTKITIVPNEARENERQPDYRIYAARGGEIGGGWNRIGKNSGKPYVSLTFANPAFGPSRIFANLARVAGADSEDTLAILWNPQD